MIHHPTPDAIWAPEPAPNVPLVADLPPVVPHPIQVGLDRLVAAHQAVGRRLAQLRTIDPASDLYQSASHTLSLFEADAEDAENDLRRVIRNHLTGPAESGG